MDEPALRLAEIAQQLAALAVAAKKLAETPLSNVEWPLVAMEIAGDDAREVRLELHPGPLLLTDVDTAVERFSCWRSAGRSKAGGASSEGSRLITQ
jgi:hypothetical protein